MHQSFISLVETFISLVYDLSRAIYIKRVPNVAGSLFEIIFEKPPSPYQILDAPCAEKFARPRAYGHIVAYY